MFSEFRKIYKYISILLPFSECWNSTVISFYEEWRKTDWSTNSWFIPVWEESYFGMINGALKKRSVFGTPFLSVFGISKGLHTHIQFASMFGVMKLRNWSSSIWNSEIGIPQYPYLSILSLQVVQSLRGTAGRNYAELGSCPNLYQATHSRPLLTRTSIIEDRWVYGGAGSMVGRWRWGGCIRVKNIPSRGQGIYKGQQSHNMG